MAMLLFVCNPYYQAICDGTKRYEMRAGSRYRSVKAGDQLSINGRFRVTVTKVEVFDRAEEASRASSAAGYYLSVAAIRACYPDGSGPIYFFHFRHTAKLAA
jgi:ASC-1-like (ASCH) protein